MPHPGQIATQPSAPNSWGVQSYALQDANRTYGSQSVHGAHFTASLDGSDGLTSSDAIPFGRVTSWQPQLYNREVMQSWELGATSYGKAIDITPGRNTTYTISGSRVEVWENEVEVALGLTTSDDLFEDLADQDRPYKIDEYLLRGIVPYRHWQYLGLWLTSANRNAVEAEGDPRIMCQFEMSFVRRARII